MINVPMLSVDMLPCPMCAGKVRSLVARPIGHGDVCFVVSCNCGLSFDGGQDMESAVRTWNRRAKPTAQQQGEPVAYWFVGDIGGYGCLYTTPDKDGINLYAEQPAPVADHTQCEECKGWGYHENHYEGGGTECGECVGSGNSTVAVAVVMPEKKSVPEPEDYNTNIDEVAFAEGYNDALDDVAKLNGVKP